MARAAQNARLITTLYRFTMAIILNIFVIMPNQQSIAFYPRLHRID